MKRKYNRGDALAKENEWIIGGVDTITGQAFMIMVEKRNAETKKKKNWADRNLKIHTDEWSVYGPVIKNLGFQEHKTVCHKNFFVNPETAVHT